MITLPPPDEAKAMARRLRRALPDHGVDAGHAHTLELVAAAYGLADWNTLAALGRPELPPPAVPLLRMIDPDRSIRFYRDLLGCQVTLDDDHVGYATVRTSTGGLLQLSDQAGDAAPGGAVLLTEPDVNALAVRIAPGWGGAPPTPREDGAGRTLTLFDPGGNRLVFREAGVTGRVSDELPPLVYELTMPEPPDQAFARFTRFGWWHRYGRADGAPVEIRDGEIVFVNPGGALSIGRVTAWDPGRRYAQTFTLAQDPAHPTWLEVLFRTDHEVTRVRFAHGGWGAGNADRRSHFTDWPTILAAGDSRAASLNPQRPRCCGGLRLRPYVTRARNVRFLGPYDDTFLARAGRRRGRLSS